MIENIYSKVFKTLNERKFTKNTLVWDKHNLQILNLAPRLDTNEVRVCEYGPIMMWKIFRRPWGAVSEHGNRDVCVVKKTVQGRGRVAFVMAKFLQMVS